MKTVLILVTSFVLGLRHALDPDHVTAVTHFISMDPRPRSGALFGFRWSIGHALTVLGVGSLVVLLGLRPPPGFERWAEVTVGITLIALAFFRLALLHKETRHEHEHAHQGKIHNHIHNHTEPSHVHPFAPTLVGMIHGAAGTFAVFVLIPISFAGSALLAFGYAAVFSLGCMISMSSYGYLMGRLYGLSAEAEIRRRYRMLVLVTSFAGLLLGIFWIIQNIFPHH